jgi:glycolate oxidase FAD binding subunit
VAPFAATQQRADRIARQAVARLGGAQRWLKSDVPAELIRQAVARIGGHATLYESDPASFHPLLAPLLRYHRNLKLQLDPQGIFNPGRLYAEV